MVSLALCLSLSACAIGPDYKAPKLDFLNGWDAGWNGAAVKKDAAIDAIKFETKPVTTEHSGAHWSDFEDADLKSLLQLAEQNNYDLKIAQARIDQAQADERSALASLFPQTSATAGVTRQTVSPPLEKHLDTEKQAGINGSWDLDVLGGNRRRLEASKAEIEAAEQDKAQTKLSVQTEVAKNYIQLRNAQQQVALTQQNLEIQNYTLKVTAAQRELGALSDFELSRAKAQVQDTESRLPPLQKGIDAAFNRLSVLTGSSPQTLKPMLGGTKPIPTLAATAECRGRWFVSERETR